MLCYVKSEKNLSVSSFQVVRLCHYTIRKVSGDYQRLAYIINDYQGVHFERLSF